MPGRTSFGIAVTVSLAVAAPSSPVSAQGQPPADTAWRYRAASDMQYIRQCPEAELLITTKKALVAIDAGTGTPLWQLDGLPDLGPGLYWGSCANVTGVSYRKDRIVAFDIGSGRRLWDQTTLPPFQEIRGYFSLRRSDLLLLFLRTAASDRSLAAVQLSTGMLRWRRDDLFPQSPRFASRGGVSDVAEYQALIADSDTTLILYFSADGPVRVDVRTGATLWKGDALAGARLPSLSNYAAMEIADSALVIPRDNGLIALDARDGHRLWESPNLLPTHASRLVALPQGLLVRAGRAFVTVLDPATGAPRWPRALTAPTDGVAYEIVRERYYLMTRDRLVAADLATGDTTGLATLAFRDDEHAEQLYALDDGLLAVSRQNMFRIDFPGTIRYHRFYPAPSPSFFEALGGALGGNVSAFGAHYGAAEFRSDYAYFLTTVPDSAGRTGNSLVRVALDDGSETGRIWFHERAPKFRADPARDQLLVFPDLRTVVAVRFPGETSALR